ncbi:hypothetical protein AB2L28_08400 [Kineococcus sp. TBRC 1896]|uniref:Uncharacterized protein n=1 Tax=Kineococcus mangrovi TaxID=1660183 RepID=A0ABV4I0Q2_9ACTN
MDDTSMHTERARADLVRAEQALRQAQAPRSFPAWLPPAAGALFAAGLACGAAAIGDWRPRALYLLAAAACLAGFLLLMVVASRAGGLVQLPVGTSRQRWLRQLPELAALLLGLVVGLGVGWAAGVLTWGVTGGAALWWRLAHQQRGAV